ncbi:hypothetical protein HZI73_04340 [Vallitalea pronyensis]|uniref:Uncharacterized protein n=1 Tax=Vallitalea pronyensis TaxID=1348613 RepID=A0A8J8SFQ0_9FIRM|nr:hypothetical protein [Vallitalea pronyensis]QUI21567.1 hypothetical protein HZI73_04340 [Vallitalea pronyensis]
MQYSFSNDVGFDNDVWENVKNIVGEKRFKQLINLSKTAINTPLLCFGVNSGLPYIAISVYYEDEHEKRVLENVLSNLVRGYLKIYGFNTHILVNWKTRHDLRMPYLLIRYARIREEKRILDIGLENDRERIITRNKVVKDHTEAEDLDG